MRRLKAKTVFAELTTACRFAADGEVVGDDAGGGGKIEVTRDTGNFDMFSSATVCIGRLQNKA
jgi:hypothetical protein